VLGNPRLADTQRAGHQGNRDSANRHARNVAPVIAQIRASGVTSLCGIAKALTARGVATARGGQWTAVQVAGIEKRSQ
jgi:hypothetical protein